MQRYGMTIPFDGVRLHDQREWMEELVELGYTDVWSAEAMGGDGFTPLALTSVWAPSLRLGTAIIPVFTRGPATLAQCAAALADAAPGRFVLGIGTSSNVIVERWNGIPFAEPYKRMRDTVRFLRSAFAGEKITHDYDTFSVKGFRLGVRLKQRPPILVAALRQGMLELAGREADGAIVNWLSAEDVATVAPIVRKFGTNEDGSEKEIVARVFVAPTEDREVALTVGRYAIAAYLTVPVYAAFHEWLGRGEQLQGLREHWKAGDRQAAVAAIPESLVDELIISGSPEQCRAHVQRYVDNGVTTPALAVLPVPGLDLRKAVRDLAPTAG
jgi:probable F420-dependent oxidoreductase